MKYTELSIGNLVYYNGNAIKIESITKRKVGYHTQPNENNMRFARMCEILPIPITEEILQKSGFAIKKDLCFTSYEINPYDGHVIDVTFYESGIDVFIRYICGRCHLRSIKYLHELQNIVSAITNQQLNLQL